MAKALKRLLDKQLFTLRDGEDLEVYRVKDVIVATIMMLAILAMIGLAGSAEAAQGL